MISTIALRRESDKARIWLSQLPEIEFSPKAVEERVLAAGQAAPTSLSVGLELFLARGPMAIYGTLGATFIPAASDGLEIKVGSAEPGASFRGSLAHGFDEVRVGLPSEFVQSVLKGLAEGVSRVQLGSGRLTVRHAAAAKVGSNSWVFERLGLALPVLLTLPPGANWQETLAALIA